MLDHVARGLVRIVVTAVSVLVLGITGTAWVQARELQDGLTTADVLDPNAAATTDQNILLVGLDTRTDAHGNPLPQALLDSLHAGTSTDGGDDTDTIIVLHVPADGSAVTAISIPRDSYVQLADGYGTHKINSAYSRSAIEARTKLGATGVSGPTLEVQAAAAGARTAIRTVEQLTGLTITHYAAVNLAGFYSLSQAVGGVPVCLNAAVHDTYSGADFRAGEQTVQGAAALEFVRQRHGLPAGDLDRIRRQQAFLAGLAHTLLSADTLTDPTKLQAVITAVQGALTIDQGWDLLGFAGQVQGITSGSITFRTIPVLSEDLHTKADGDAVEVNPTQVRAFVQGLVDPSAAASAPTTTPAPTPSTAVKKAAHTAAPATPTPAPVPAPAPISAGSVTCVD
jgi:LCP family protein required for cell wall assembly